MSNPDSESAPPLRVRGGRGSYFPLVILAFALSFFWHQRVLAPVSPPAPVSSPLTRDVTSELRGEGKGGGERTLQTTTLLAVGDILLSRNVGHKIDQAGDPNLPFEKLRELLSSADITFGNLECPLSDSDIPVREGLVFRCLTKYVPGLVNAGFDVLSTANNHALDQGAEYVGFTRDYLLSQNILAVGNGKNQEEAWAPAVFSPPPVVKISRREKGKGEMQEGVRIAFLAASYASHNDGGKSRNDYVARIEDLPNLQSAISNLSAQDGSASGGKSKPFIIVSMHAGTEYTRDLNQEQIDFAHAAIDAGADVVLGHHPHWIQTIEVYPPLSPPALPQAEIGGDEEGVHRGIIFYSLGNFVFDQSWSQETREGLAVKLQISNSKLQTAELIPVVIESNCCPRLATNQEKTAILKKINLESDTIEFSPP